MKKTYRITAVMIASCLISACHDKQQTSYDGYIEGRLTMSGAPNSGRITAMYVHRGDTVKAGQPLYAINAKNQRYNVNISLAALKAAQAKLADLERGQRQPKLNEIIARIHQAQAEIKYAKLQMLRNRSLVKSNSVSQDTYDQARKDLNVSIAKLEQNQAALAAAKLPARQHQIMQAKAELAQAQTELNEARYHLRRLTVPAYTSGFVFDNYHRTGERVTINQPVLSIQSPKNIRALFFIPEPALSTLHIGEAITVHFDPNQQVPATISYISPDAEYTPPVIYSRQTRSTLVYRIEARFTHSTAKKMHPGQPISVSIG